MINSKQYLLSTILILCCLCTPARSQDWQALFDQPEQSNRNIIARDLGIASGLMTAWGIAQWDWFRHRPQFQRERWFGADTHAGGADKTGHFYMSYLLSDVFLWDFRRHGVANPERKAALSALATMTLLEIGDATSSKYGFSHEDFIADAGGVLASWWLAKNPHLDELIDIRMEYWPSDGFNMKEDLASDYTGMKHLLAFNGSAIDKIKHTPLKFLELQTGYYTRGFRTYDTPLTNGPERHFFVGIGLSLPAVFERNKVMRTLSTYLQIPHLQTHTSWEF